MTISNRSVSLIVTRTGRQVSVFAEKLIHRPMSMTCVGKPDIWWHPLTQAGSTASALPLHDIKYYSSCDVNKFPVKSFPLIISVKFIILFETSKTTAASNSQFTNIGQNYAIYFLSIFRKYLANYSSYFSIHPPLDFAPFIFSTYLQYLFENIFIHYIYFIAIQ